MKNATYIYNGTTSNIQVTRLEKHRGDNYTIFPLKCNIYTQLSVTYLVVSYTCLGQILHHDGLYLNTLITIAKFRITSVKFSDIF